DENESQTHGITIRHLYIPVTLPTDPDTPGSPPINKTIKAHLWDFGGQEIMHASHQFFLSKRSLYILVLDGREEQKADYWLKHIENFGGNSPVLMVINKTDENPAFDLNRNSLKRNYDNINGFYRISCKTGAGMDEFHTALKAAIPHVELLKTEVAASWLKVKQKLENRTDKTNYLNHQQFREICSAEKIEDETQRTTLIEFLNELGVVLHFPMSGLENFHVLNPRWVTEAVYKIINSTFLTENNGILEKNKRNYVLNEEKSKTGEYDRKPGNTKYTSPEQSYIVSLMEEFKLCYFLDKETILVPELLDNQDPDYRMPEPGGLKFLIEYDFLPKSLLPRLMIRLHKSIKGEFRWRSGMVLEDGEFGTISLVRVNPAERTLFIHITGRGKRDHLSYIRRTLKEIYKDFEKLEYDEYIPLPGSDPEGGNRQLVPYKSLLGHEESGVSHYFHGETQESFGVDELLDSVVSPRDRIEDRHGHGVGRDGFDSPKPMGDINEDREILRLREENRQLTSMQKDSQNRQALEKRFETLDKQKKKCDALAKKKAGRFMW
ncbi:MAG: hypothetical protein GY940_24890, partial [bacterium]|nr:hypothetical protein [bacterium]